MAFYYTVKQDGDFGVLTDNSGRIISRHEWLELSAAMNDFYERNSDASIIEYNAGAVERRMNELKVISNSGKPKEKNKGFVYFIAYERHGIKIGYTRNLQGRLNQLRIASPFPLTLIGSIETDDPESLERYAHQFFDAYKINSEWFSIDEIEIFDFINRYQK